MDEPSATTTPRRHRRVAALVITVSVVAVIAGGCSRAAAPNGPGKAAGSHSTGTAAGPHGTSTATGSSSATSPPPSSSRQTGRLAACRGSQFLATVGSSGGTAAQRYVVISLLNKSRAGCTLSGYPQLSINARSATGVVAALSTSIHHGSVAGHADPGAQRVAIGADASTSFMLGVPDSSSATKYSIGQLRVSLPDSSVPIPVSLSLTGSAQAHQPMQLTVTAFVAGSNGPH